MSSPPTQSEVQALVNLINSNTLLNRQLQSVCQVNGLKSSGVKADLQRRIVDHIVSMKHDQFSFAQIKRSVDSARGYAPQAQSPSQINSSLSPRNMTAFQYAIAANSTGSTYPGAAYQTQHTNAGYSRYSSRISFKPSPFYDVKAPLADTKTCDSMVNHRNSVRVSLAAHEVVAHITDPSMRVMVFCADSDNGAQDIAFPHQSDLKVNGGELKANLRGMKNKRGTTKPVDITDLLRQKPTAYINNIEFTYALTDKGRVPPQHKSQRFYLCIFACKVNPHSVLVDRIKSGNKISRQSVIQEITRKNQDDDIEATEIKVSLLDPLTYMRVETPVRSVTCKHIQCFDITSYLQLQDQGPQWNCPICNQPAPFDQLAVDEYIREILAATRKSVEQVTIEPNGKWSVEGSNAEEIEDSSNKVEPASYVVDDDLIISSVGLNDVSLFTGRNTSTPARSIHPPSTPNTGVTRDGASIPRSVASAGTKRPAEVIDLTLSDDDEPSHPPPPKRQYFGNGNGNGNSLY